MVHSTKVVAYEDGCGDGCGEDKGCGEAKACNDHQ